MNEVNPVIESSWKAVLQEEFRAEYFLSLKHFLLKEKEVYRIYPPGSQIFNVFNLTPFQQVRVVILGQDPYHGAGQAHGLCFSVPRGTPRPPSLLNIFREMEADIAIPSPPHGDLTGWAQQGVLLLNAILTVRENQAGSHHNQGWERFTDRAIRELSEKSERLVFVLWGNYAMAKRALIDGSKHLILTAAHPSPFSAHKGFFGCRHFSKINDFLNRNGRGEIDWRLS